MGLEPTIPGLGGRCLIHWATGASHCMWVEYVEQLKAYEIAHTRIQLSTQYTKENCVHEDLLTYASFQQKDEKYIIMERRAADKQAKAFITQRQTIAKLAADFALYTTVLL